MPKNNTGVVVVGCIGLIPAVIIGYVLRGWALVTLWAWFVTPKFHIEPPNAAVAIGIGILAGMLTGTSDLSSSKSDSDEDDSALTKMLSVYGQILCRAPLAVGIGWIVKHWA
jgi:hypothetical protein